MVILFAAPHANATPGRTPARVVFTQVPAHRSGPEIGPTTIDRSWQLPQGSRLVSLDRNAPNDALTILTPQFAMAGRADVSFDGERILFVGALGEDDAPSVWEMGLDEMVPREIVAPKGRVVSAVYLSTMYTLDAEAPSLQIAYCVEAPDTGITSLFTCREDGSRQRQITFTPDGAFDPYLLSDGRLLFSSWRRGGSGTGENSALFTVNTDGTDVALFTAAHESPRGRGIPCQTPDGVYHSPSPLSDGRFLVSYRKTGRRDFGIYVFDPAAGVQTPLFDFDGWHDLYAQAVRARPRPPGRSSGVNDKQDTGLIYCLDAYLQGTQRAPADADNRIARVRVIGWHGMPESRNRRDEGEQQQNGFERILGEAPVEADGSFCLEVPARIPLRLQTLGADGNLLRDMQSWIWIMPNENRGCIGCHEDRQLAPPNRYPSALKRQPHPMGLGQQPVIYLGRPLGHDR